MTNEMGAEEQAIKQVIYNLEEAWNRHDAKAYSLVFAEDANFTNVFGQKAHGRATIGNFTPRCSKPYSWQAVLPQMK